MDLPANILGADKLLAYVLSGLGSVAGPLFAPWRARREADAKRLEAHGAADALKILAAAQAEAGSELAAANFDVGGQLALNETINQAMQFSTARRLRNVESVVEQAREAIGEKEVPDEEPNHDWTARFFSHAQDVSSEELQTLWAKVLAGEVGRPGSTSLRTLSLLRDLDQITARQFRTLCSMATIIQLDNVVVDARVPSLGGNASSNSLSAYGLDFGVLNILNEHGLIISDYNSWYDYKLCGGFNVDGGQTIVLPFSFQGKMWRLVLQESRSLGREIKVHGVALTHAGGELASAIDLEVRNDYSQALGEFFQKMKLQMIEVPS